MATVETKPMTNTTNEALILAETDGADSGKEAAS